MYAYVTCNMNMRQPGLTVTLFCNTVTWEKMAHNQVLCMIFFYLQDFYNTILKLDLLKKKIVRTSNLVHHFGIHCLGMLGSP